jgi:hypothetical protein
VLVEHSPPLKLLSVSPWPLPLPVIAEVGASQHQREFSTGIDSAERSRYYIDLVMGDLGLADD